MSYNLEELPNYVKTAGKVSVLAAVVGLGVFMFALMVDVGQQELQRVSAQSNIATTSLTVVNTPPVFTAGPYELTESSTTTPTNSGDVVQWGAIATDANGADYYMLVCSNNATPTAQTAPATPTCHASAIQWGVSTATVSGTAAVVSTTTIEVADNAGTQFAESNDWYAWVCDGDSVQPVCSPTGQQGVAATNSSPFNMNQRPVLTAATTYGEVDPGSALTFFSSSTDPDSVGGADTLGLVVCSSTANYNTVTNTCTDSVAFSAAVAAGDATAATTTPAIIRDQSYSAFAYLIDNHGHEASAPFAANFTVANVAPTVLGGDIDLNGGNPIVLLNLGAETSGYTLDFTVSDANSCINSGGATSSEIVDYSVALFRSPTFTTGSCDPAAPNYEPNHCYTSGVATTTWNISCTASTTSCTGITDDTQIFNCSFPLWFVADPTDSGPYAADEWVAAVSGSDDDFATSSLVATTNPVELQQLAGLSLLTAAIPYGSLAPGDAYVTLSTTTTIANVGNTGIDQEVDGSAMCPPYVSSSTDCSLVGTSTIFTSNQEFSATPGTSFGSGTALPTTTVATPAEVEINAGETTSTSSALWATGTTYWGIGVPSAISVAGAYTGQNTFYGKVDDEAGW